MEPELFATGSDRGVYHHALRATHLHSMGGRPSATPSVLRNADGMLEVYVRGVAAAHARLRRQNGEAIATATRVPPGFVDVDRRLLPAPRAS